MKLCSSLDPEGLCNNELKYTIKRNINSRVVGVLVGIVHTIASGSGLHINVLPSHVTTEIAEKFPT